LEHHAVRIEELDAECKLSWMHFAVNTNSTQTVIGDDGFEGRITLEPPLVNETAGGVAGMTRKISQVIIIQEG